MVVLIEKVTSADRYLARRLLTFSKVKENDTLTEILQTIKEGKLPLPESLDQLHSQWNMLKREDEIFSDIGLKDRQQKSIMNQNDYQTTIKKQNYPFWQIRLENKKRQIIHLV